MRRASVVAAGFALAGGRAADPAGIVHVAPGPDRFGRILLACVEPLEPSPRGLELAAVALRAMRQAFAGSSGTAPDALVAAFAAANAAVIAENRPQATGRWERRICVGATGIALFGSDIIIAQALPSQAILVQDGQIYAFPDVASWRGDYQPDSPAMESHPLGFAEDAAPRFYHSESAPGDLIALCATSVGRALGRDEDAAIELYGGSLLTDDLEGSVDRLERLLARHDAVDAFAVIAAVTRLPKRSRLRPARVGPRRETTGSGVWPRQKKQAAVGDVPVVAPLTVFPSGETERGPAFEGMRDWLIRASEVVSGVRRKPEPRFDARQVAMAAPGALSVSRYRDSSGLPAEWMANLPRGPGVHVPARLLAVSLVVFLAIGGTGVAVGHQRDREARVASSLAEVDVALQSAIENSLSATSSVAQAEAALTAARDAGATGEPLLRREHELASVRDQAWGVGRLTDVARLGALPREQDAGTVQLALSGRTLYLAAGSLFELDPDGQRLVSLLAEGDPVTGGTAGDLQNVSIDGGNVVVSDGAATYVRDKAGVWQRHALAVQDIGELRAGVPLISWGEAAYGLSWQGDIIRFEQSPGGPLADIWAAIDETPDLDLTRDMAIDGRIHVLLQDGRLLTFSRGALVGTISPFVVPTLNQPAFLAQAPFATDFYIVDPTARIGENVGRIVRVDAAGNARQYQTPQARPGDQAGTLAAMALANAQDMAIDEMTGTVYWVSNGEIWRGTLPLA
jgi:hypothetical protein